MHSQAVTNRWELREGGGGQGGLGGLGLGGLEAVGQGLVARSWWPGAGGQGFAPDIMGMTAGYIHEKEEENGTKRNSQLFNPPPINCTYLAT